MVELEGKVKGRGFGLKKWPREMGG